MKNILFILISIVLHNCAGNKKAIKANELTGKWIVLQKDNEFIIKIDKDSILSMYSYETIIESKMKINSITRNRIIMTPIIEVPIDKDSIKSGYRNLKTQYSNSKISYKYYTEGKTLTLINEETNEKTSAINCTSGKCDEQKDYFRLQPISINLPNTKEDKKKYIKLSYSENDINVYVGSPKQKHIPIYGERTWVCSPNKFLEIFDFEVLLLTELNLKNTLDEPKLKFFIDGETKMSFVKELYSSNQEKKVSEMYI